MVRGPGHVELGGGESPLSTMKQVAKVVPGAMFGMWSILERVDANNVACVCACGTKRQIHKSNLSSGKTKSCGCQKSNIISSALRKHGQYKTSSYRIWGGILSRCTNPKVKGYPHYGGRGIKVCERWRDYTNFVADMGERPKGMSIERIDVDGDYEPNNCKWATAAEQARNTRRTKLDETLVARIRRGELGAKDVMKLTGACASTYYSAKNEVNWKASNVEHP